jgi:outer membrane murein-binding lipoprotein Lpp
MNKVLIDKLLNGQSTPEEEHLVAKMLQQEEAMDRWLTEDETEKYDRIVSQRRARRRVLRWAVAAVAVVLVAAGAAMLWPGEQASDAVAEQKAEEVTEPMIHDAEPVVADGEASVAVIAPSSPAVSPKKVSKRVNQETKATTTDSLQYYIARLEKELENVNESTYAAKAEEVLRADARLQKLVQRIMMGELTKDDVPAEAMNTNQTMEEQP